MKYVQKYSQFINESNINPEVIKLLKSYGINHKIDYRIKGKYYIVDDMTTAEEITDAIADRYTVTISDNNKKEIKIQISESLNESLDYESLDYEKRKEVISELFPHLMPESVKDYAIYKFENLPPEMQKEIAETYNIKHSHE